MQLRPYNVFFIFVLIVFIVEMASIGHTIRVYREYKIPDEQTLLHSRDTGLTIEDRNGSKFFTFHAPERSVFIPLKDIPVITQEAVLASEDRDFRSHGALSIAGIFRAIMRDIQTKSLAYGGSTITQQVVKNTMLSPEKSFSRKYREMILAYKLEKTYSKDTILELYLNTAYFGRNAFGIEAAAQTYYGKHAQQLTVGESATLAALLPAPSDLTITHGVSSELTARKQSILQYLAQEQRIATADISTMLNDYGTVIPRTDQNIYAPYFAIMVRDQLVAQLGEEAVLRDGLHVRTSIDPALQQEVEQILLNQKSRLATYNANNAAVVVIDVPSREVRAFAGNISWNDSISGKIDMATIPRQPGSSFKPIVYATAFERNIITPASLLQDIPTTYKIDTNRYYSPQDFTRSFLGPVSARFALSNSLNIPAVQVLHMTGGDNVIAKASGMGIKNLPDTAKSSLSLALGSYEVSPYDMTNAFATFAAHGHYETAHPILSITDKFGTVIPLPPSEERQAVDSNVAYLITSILSDEKTRSHIFGSLLSYHEPVALKTGTSSDYKDGWTLGYTNTTTVGVWVGNSDNTPMKSEPGAILAAPLWKAVLDAATKDNPPTPFEQPLGVVRAYQCAISSPSPAPGTWPSELFLTSNIQPGYCVPH